MVNLTNEASIVYGDESSFNLWLRSSKTWATPDQRIRMPLNVTRGQGITLLGAIGEQMSRPVFYHGVSTNPTDFIAYLKEVRSSFKQLNTTILLVLDNHSTHKT